MDLGHGLDLPISAEGQELSRRKSSDFRGGGTPPLGEKRPAPTMSKIHRSL